MTGHQRKTVYFRGHVQGVGFRLTTRRIAQQFDVAGFVKNLPDGRVQLVVEGGAQELEKFVSEVEAALDGCIQSRKSDTQPASGEFAGFEIRY